MAAGCRQAPAQERQEPKELLSKPNLPTATEVFDLRTKCANLGQKVNARTAGPKERDTITVTSVKTNYSVSENRCYVVLDDSFISGVMDGSRTRMLYDGQTSEFLAAANHDVLKKYDHDEWSGLISDRPLTECEKRGDGPCEYSYADAYIDSKMKRDE
jgi:hypothetical protein